MRSTSEQFPGCAVTGSSGERQVVIVAPATVRARSVRDILRDWSAIGWLDAFCWLEAIDEHEVGDWTADVIERGVSRRENLQRALADVPGLASVHVVVLTCLGEMDRCRVPRDLGELVWDRLQGGRAEVIRTHCIAARHGYGDWNPDVAWAGWRCRVLAPEDSWSPSDVPAPMTGPLRRRVPTDAASVGAVADDGGWVVREDTDPRGEAEYSGHVAAGLCAAAALWGGIEVAGPDMESGVAGRPDVVLLRSFVRRLDASEVTAQLRDRLLDTARRVPRPTDGRQDLPVVRDPGRASQRCVDQLCEKHASLLSRTRENIPTPGPGNKHWWQILKEFFAYLGVAVSSAPARMLAGLPDRSAAALAKHVEGIVFGGAETSYVVEVAGVTRTRRRVVDMERLSRSADALVEQVGCGRYRGVKFAETGSFWQDAVRLGMSLIDGADRVSGITLPMMGPTTAIIDDPARVAPAAHQPFRPDPAVGAAIGAESVSAADVFRQRQIRERLELFSQDADQGLRAAAGRSLLAMRRWQTALGDVYMCQIGERIDTAVREAIGDINDLARRISALSAIGDEPVAEERLRRNRRWVRVTLGLAAVAVVVLGTMSSLRLISWAAFGTTAPLLVLGILGVLFEQFYRTGQEEFAALHRLRQLEGELPILHRNLVWAAADLQRFLVMYRQYLAWADLLGAFMAHPHGQSADRRVDTPPLIGPLPRAVQVGRALSVEDRVRKASMALQPTVYGVGWLEVLWQEALHAGLRRAADRLEARTTTVEELWFDMAVEGSPLKEVAGLWTREGVESNAGEQAWRESLRRLLRSDLQRVRDDLLGEVDDVARDELPSLVVGTGPGRRVVWSELSNEVSGVFEPGVLTGSARGLDLGAVRSSRLHSWEEQWTGESLDRLEVLVQYSAAIEADLLCLTDDGTDADRPGPRAGGPGGNKPDVVWPPPDSVCLQEKQIQVDSAADDLMDF